LLKYIFLTLCADKSFDDEESVDGNRPSSAASAFKVPAPKTSGNPVNSARKPGSAGGPKVGGASKEGGAGAVDEDDFIKAFTDVPSVQVRVPVMWHSPCIFPVIITCFCPFFQILFFLS
uniref:Uncharacterized protein n=1 Tax=Capra hircus TaxID=9925 RepID=A0A8C2S420_CAPHI